MEAIRKISFLILSLCINIIQAQTYLDTTKSIDERVNDLLSRMSLAEKIGQMTQADHAAISDLNDVKTYFLGSILSGGGSDPKDNSTESWADLYNSFQQKALETRLGIPIIYGIDAVHGHSNVNGAVIFPHNIGLGATRNPELIRKASKVIADEISATGINWTFAPCIAVARNEKWGRTYESFGETPQLAQMFASTSVEGFQSDSLITGRKIAACAKHYLGDGGTTDGNDQGNTEIDEETLREIHLPGYIEAINSGVKTIMASYSSWNGIKMHGNKYLLTDVLKNELGFEGFVVSDWAAIDQLEGSYKTDIEKAINAGIDMVMVPNRYKEFIELLKQLVLENKVPMARINDAVKRILKVKFELGLFEKPLSDKNHINTIGNNYNREVARQCVRESLVLLKNKKKLLPIKSAGKRILVVGKHADNLGLQCGGWTIEWQGHSGNKIPGTTILSALKEEAPNNTYIYNESGDLTETNYDFAIAVIGEEPYAEGNGDRDDLHLPKEQIRMIKELKEAGLKVITILISGRPLICNEIIHYSDAFIAAWLPGTEGKGITDILLGKFQPSGKLPHSWPKSMEEIPINIGDNDYKPLFPYGYGIKYNFKDTLSSALFNPEKNVIELSLPDDIDKNSLENLRFEIRVNGNDIYEITNVSIAKNDSSVLFLQLSENINFDSNSTISYVDGNIKFIDGTLLNKFSDKIIFISNSSVKRFYLPGKIEAEDYSSMQGIQTEQTTDDGGGLNVGWIDSGDWLEYYANTGTAGTYTVIFRVASLSNGGALKLMVNDEHNITVNIPVTYGWQNWKTVSSIVDLPQGNFTIKLLAEKGGFNINWFSFDKPTNISEAPNELKEFRLFQNYPNPFNPSTQIDFNILTSGFYSLTIYDTVGKEFVLFHNKFFETGSYKYYFSGVNYSSGVYFYKLEGENKKKVMKMVLLK